METRDDPATGSLIQRRDKGVDKAGHRANQHGGGKRQSVQEMTEVGFAYRGRMPLENTTEHAGLLVQASINPLRRKRLPKILPIELDANEIFFKMASMEKMFIDTMDRKILRELQRDVSRPLAEVAAAVGLSSSPCWNRIRRLETAGYIRERVAILDRDLLDLGVTVFVAVKTNQHQESWLTDFAASISAIPEVVEFYRMSGEVDYLLKVVCKDIADYDRIYKSLIKSHSIFDVSSSFAMEQIKCTTLLPIGS